MALILWQDKPLIVDGKLALDERCCCGTQTCYRITSAPPGWSDDCCAASGCCNYGFEAIDELLTGGPPIWSAWGRGPVGTSDWTLERQGAGPNYTWVLTNTCQAGCHPGAYTGTAIWDGRGSKVFAMGPYPPVTVTKVNCP